MNEIPYHANEIKLLLLLSRSVVGQAQTSEIKQLLTCDLDWSYLLNLAQRSKVVPLVFQNLNGPFAHLTDEANYKLLKKTLERYIRSNLLLTQSMIQLVNHFKALNITLAPFKGPILSQTAYQKPFHRYFEDLDFLVSQQDFAKVSDEFLRMGLIENYLNEPDYYRQSQFAAEQTRVVIDLHYALTPIDCFIKVDTDSLMSHVQTFSFNGVDIETFSLIDTLIILCVDAAKGYWRSIIRLVDISELLRNQTLDWTQLFNRAAELECEQVVTLGLFLAQRLLDAPVPMDIQSLIRKRVKCNLEDEDIYRQIFKLRVGWIQSIRWHCFNIQTIRTWPNRLRYLYRLGKFSLRTIPYLKERLRT